MSPPTRRRRRRRRFSSFAKAGVGTGAAALVVVLLIIGGLAKVGSSSTAYWQAVNRSFALEVRALDAQSAALAAQLGRLVPAMPGMTRAGLEVALDTAVRRGQAMAASASLFATPAPSGTVGQSVADAFADRASAVTGLRGAVDGLLEMAPLAVAGAPATTGPAPRPALSASSAAAAMARAGVLLVRADRLYAAARRALRAAPGHARLPASAWVGSSLTWGPARASEVIGAVAASPQLAPVDQVVLVNGALAMTPPPLPPGPTPPAAGTSSVPPTHALTLTAVVANQGNVDAGRVTVVAICQPVTSGGRSSRTSRVVAVPAGGSIAVGLRALAVSPGRSYTVTVTVAAAGAAAGTDSSDTFVVDVAPATPPTSLG